MQMNILCMRPPRRGASPAQRKTPEMPDLKILHLRGSSARRRRDLNPRAAINDLHPFQGCPFGQLGYFSVLDESLRLMQFAAREKPSHEQHK